MGSEDHASVNSEDRDSVDSEQQACASTVPADSTEVPHSTVLGGSMVPGIGHRAVSTGPAFTGPGFGDPGLASGEQATTGLRTHIIARGTTAVPTIVRGITAALPSIVPGTVTGRPTLIIVPGTIGRAS